VSVAVVYLFGFKCHCLLVQLQVPLFTCSASSLVFLYVYYTILFVICQALLASIFNLVQSFSCELRARFANQSSRFVVFRSRCGFSNLPDSLCFVVVYHIGIILLLSAFYKPSLHLFWKEYQSFPKSLLPKDLRLSRRGPLALNPCGERTCGLSG